MPTPREHAERLASEKHGHDHHIITDEDCRNGQAERKSRENRNRRLTVGEIEAEIKSGRRTGPDFKTIVMVRPPTVSR